MKSWGQKVVAGLVAALFMGLAACSHVGYQGGQASQAPSYSEKNGKIVLDSICADHKAGSRAYRGCAAKADQWLDGQCQKYRGLFTSSDSGTAQRYRHEYYKFCDAAEAWQAP
jgi:hypothetical protein